MDSLQTILFLGANPKDTVRKRLDQEFRDISDGLERAQKRDQFDLQQKWAVRPRDIQRAMLDVKPQIVHFSGSGENGLIFEDESGNSKLVNGTAIASLFKLFVDKLSCVVLNGCYSEIQAVAIAQHIPYVIGMNKMFTEQSSITFSVGFYDALGAGRDIEFAFQLGCTAIQMEESLEFAIPVFYKNGTLIQGNPEQHIIKSSISEPPAISPEGMEDRNFEIIKVCEAAYPHEKIRLIEWSIKENQQFCALFRECRRGWYIQLNTFQNDDGEWISTHKVCSSFLPLLEPDEHLWHKLTVSASSEDWYAIDEIIRLSIKFPESEIRLAGQYLIGESVADEAMEHFGVYVPDKSLLPALLFINKTLNLLLVSYLKHPNGFAKESIVCNDNTNDCYVFSSLKEAHQKLEKDLYLQELQSNSGNTSISSLPNMKSVKSGRIDPLEVFIAYSHKDDDLRSELETHLSSLKRDGKISPWYDRAIEGGSEWEALLKAKLESSPIILLLISANFLASDYCYDTEMKRAIERHEKGTAVVIPIILRPCDWLSSPFSKLQALPKNIVPITKWDDRDSAFLDVVQSIRRVVESLPKK
jgi:hypothetical protein